MTIRNNDGFKNALTTAVRGKGIFLALALAAAAFQGCTTEDKPMGPATDAPAAAAIAEDATGADLKPDGSLVNPGETAIAAPKGAGLGKLAPDCIDMQTYPGWNRRAKVWNACGRNVRLRFIWRWAPDGQCHEVYRDETYEESREWPAFLTELRSC